MDKIAVLVPCFNEAKTIEKVIKDWQKALPKAKIYVYDNNSSDHSDRIAKNAGATVRYARQQGKGNVIRQMFREINAECYVMIDGDDTYPADSAQQLIDAVLKDGADMVVGDRLSSTYYNENKRLFHGVGNTMVRWAINTFFRGDIKDIMTGCRAFSYKFVKTFPVLSQGFEVETEMSVWAIDKNLFIKNIPINYKDRPKGSESKLNTYSDGFKVIMTIIRLFRTYKPMAFFGIISILLALVATLFLIPVLMEYAKTGLVPNFPTLIVCGFVYLAAVQSFFAGLILKTLRQKDKQDFEQQLKNVYLFRK